MNNSKNDDDEGLKYYHTKVDQIDNSLTTPPHDERIRIPAIWVFEVFPPSYISNLRNAADNLGWTQSERVLNPDFLDSVDRMRCRLSGGGGWLNLGYIVRDSSHSLNMNRQAELPEGVDVVHASILQYVPSTTILALQFLLDADTANALEQPLRESYSTYKERITNGWKYHNVESQKKLAVELTRESVRTLCSEWVKKYFPGLYSSGQFGESFPSCEIVTFNKSEPYQIINKKKKGSFLSMLNLDFNHYAWGGKQIPGLYLQYEERDNEIYKLVLSGNISKILENRDLRGYGSDTREGQILHWLTDIDNTIGIWVLYVIALSYEKQLGVLRDSYGTLDFSRLDSAASEAQVLDKKLLNLQSNLTPFIHELLSVCNDVYFLHDVYEFIPVAEHRKNDRGFFDGLRERLLMLAESLRSNEGQINDISSRKIQLATVISSDNLSKINIRLQRGIFWMTWVLLILTCILVVSEIKDNEFIKYLLQYFSK